ncbi:MAG TPA: hypothetical protein VJ892_01915, partial [Candidatus Absconditabacterales bacterium]|nr:hypothetical protein [Candidatus Absconditabacterales bacterium]
FVQERINVVNEILDDIGANQPRLMVFNKIDLIDDKKLNEIKQNYKEFNPVFISIHKEVGIENLKEKITNFL